MSAIAPAQVAQKAERETGAMAKYLISFPSAAMVVPEGEWEDVVRDSHAVIEEAKAAGVYVFGGGIDEGVPPVLVSATARSPRAATLGHPRSTGVSPCWNCPPG